MKMQLLRLLFSLFIFLFLFNSSSTVFGAANIVIVNVNAAGIGFNDPTPAVPVGGNPGTTIGAQRLNAFQAAANAWGATLTSSITITVNADFVPQTCTSNSAVLGSAGSNFIFRDFGGAPFSGTWYSNALADKISGTNNNPADAEINAHFNSSLGGAGCLDGIFFYYGFDNNHGQNKVDLFTVVLHELGHGLGFQTFTNAGTGVQNSGFPTIYDRFLLDATSGKSWLQMSNAERAASTLNTHKLVWNGPNVLFDTPGVLTLGGKDTFNKPQLYTPGSFSSGSSVSHWDTDASPNQLMEPAINGDLTHNVISPSDLTFSQLKDIGWATTSLPSSIATTTGNNQNTPVNTSFTTPITVTVSPAVAGLAVTWTGNAVSGANGTFPSTSSSSAVTTTNAGGVATAPQFNANNTTGAYTLTATVPGAGSTTFNLTNTAGATPTNMTANAGTTPQNTTVNAAFTNALAVTVTDAGNNPVSGVNVTFTAPGAGASGTFSNATNAITVATNASGIASAPFTANSTAGGPYNVVASATNLTSVNFFLTNNPGPAASMTTNAGTTPQSAAISAAYGVAPSVTIRDASSNPISGINVTFTAPAGGASGTFTNGTNTIIAQTNLAGIASAPFTANSTAGGPYNVTAASLGLTTVNFVLTNTAGTPTSMTANAGTTPQSAIISTAFTNAPAVTIRDAGNNPVPGINVTFTAPAAGASGVFSNATNTIIVQTNASGVASAPFAANTAAGGPYNVTAAASGLTTVNFALTNLTGSATQMSTNPNTTPQTATINSAFGTALGVTVRDSGSNPVSGVNVTFTAPAAGASGTFSNASNTIIVQTNASGIASAPITANATAGGPYNVTASANGVQSVNFALTNNAGGASTMTTNANTTPQNATVNTAFGVALSVTVQDAGTNPVAGVNVTFTAPASGASGRFSNNLTAISVATNASGVASASFTANSIAGGPYNVVASAPGLNSVNFSLNNAAGAASTMTSNVGTTPQSAVINTNFANALAVTVRDSSSNPVSGVSITFTAPAAGASGTFSNATNAITAFTNASGVASASLMANATAGGPYNVVASAPGLASVNFALTNTAGVANSMSANAGTTPQSAPINTSVGTPLAVTVRDGGNNPVSGVSVTFTAPGVGVSGTFSNSTNTITTVTNASGIASAAYTVNSIAGGPYNVVASSLGLTPVNFAITNNAGASASMTAIAGSSPQSATVNSAFANPLAVTIRDAGNNPVPGVNVTFTSPAAGASGLFSNATNTITIPTNSSGISSATFTANATAGGPYNVTAASAGLTTVNLSLTNTAASSPSTTSVSSSANPSVFGQTVTFTATVASTPPGGTPTGNVSFFDGANPLCQNVALDGNSQAQCGSSLLSLGNHTINAQYSGSGLFDPSNGTLANGQTVNIAGTSTTITNAASLNANSTVTGQSYTVQWNVAASLPASGTPTGIVTISDGTSNCFAAIAAGQCTIISSTAGQKSLVASYGGDGNYSSSNSAGAPHNVAKANTTTTITNSAALANATGTGQAYAVNWNTTVNGPGGGTPTGNVTVSDGTDSCQAAVAAGTCNLTSTTGGAKSIVATYVGDNNFNASPSTGVPHTVSADAAPTAAATAANVNASGGTTYTFTVTYTDDNGINVSTLDNNDVRVTGPGAFNAAATFVNVNTNTNGTPRVATYSITPPGGSWDSSDNGPYSVVMQAGQVGDTGGNFVGAGSVGTFVVSVPLGNNQEGNINRSDPASPDSGDGAVDLKDLQWYDNFINGTFIPAGGGPAVPLAVGPTVGENQRRDIAPVGTGGDGCINAQDRQQMVLFSLGIGAPGAATGPSVLNLCPPPRPEAFDRGEGRKHLSIIDPSITRGIRVVSGDATAGGTVSVGIEMDAVGDETMAKFSLAFDPHVLSIDESSFPAANASIAVADGVPNGTALAVNASRASEGQLTLLLNFDGAIPTGTGKRIVNITFRVARGATGETVITVPENDGARQMVDGAGQELKSEYDRFVTIPILDGKKVIGRAEGLLSVSPNLAFFNGGFGKLFSNLNKRS